MPVVVDMQIVNIAIHRLENLYTGIETTRPVAKQHCFHDRMW
jgi:hypothetical protein